MRMDVTEGNIMNKEKTVTSIENLSLRKTKQNYGRIVYEEDNSAKFRNTYDF